MGSTRVRHLLLNWLALMTVGLMPGVILALGPFDPSPAWPLCGRITENPPAGWDKTSGCPSQRWGNPTFNDGPIASTFGPRLLFSQNYRFDFHRGIDIATPTGTPIFAFADGIVRIAGPSPYYRDPLVQLRHYRPGFTSCKDGASCYHTNYMHLSDWSVAKGDRVHKGDLIGYTGASGNGFEHLHFAIRDAPAQDPYSAWWRDSVHPLIALPYPDRGASTIRISQLRVDVTNPQNPIVSATITMPLTVELDLDRVEIEAYKRQADSRLAPIAQPGATPVGHTIEETGYWARPPFYSMMEWSRQYSYKNSRSIPWDSFRQNGIYRSPYWQQLPKSHNANIHLDAQYPGDPQVGEFNGWRFAPNHTNTSTEYVLSIESRTLTGTSHAEALCIRIRALDVHANATAWQQWNCEAHAK